MAYHRMLYDYKHGVKDPLIGVKTYEKELQK